jgi:propionyl-CoA carboxylase alpha chain
VPATVRRDGPALVASVAGRAYTFELQGPLREVAVHGRCNGSAFCAQVERVGLDYRIVHDGRTVLPRVLAPRGAELYALMPVKPPPDLSRFLLSPMPGLLVDIAVQPGQKVTAGEKLAVIEAMKMENILVAAQDGTVSKIVAAKGESLAVDQVILEFA